MWLIPRSGGRKVIAVNREPAPQDLDEEFKESTLAQTIGGNTRGTVPGGSGAPERLVGKTLSNKFELIAFVGSGGMSEVYKARHIITGKISAVKVLHEKRAQDEMTVRRLKQEAQAAGALMHSNILGVHDFGIDDSGTPFLVMDFVDGMSLAEILQTQGPLKLDRFLRVMQQVASALAHAQDHNVVHRDLKPSNIMIMNDGGKDHVKIVDFGIAKVIVDDADTLQRLTQTGETFGSPLYMSPEQCTGANVDSRSDIYAFGCVMYEALSGTAPHAGESVFDTINRHINSPPSELHAPGIETDSIKKRLESIILRCLAKSPKDRYQKASQIESELKKVEHATGSGALSHIENAWNLVQAKQAAKRKSRMPLLVAMLCLMSILSITSSALFVHFGFEFDRSYKQLERANTASAQFFRCYVRLTQIYKYGQLYVVHRDPKLLQDIRTTHQQIRDQFAETDKLLADQPELRARYRHLDESFENGVAQFNASLESIPPGGNFISGMGMLRRFARESNAVQNDILLTQSNERDQLALLSEKVRSDQRNLIATGAVCLLLNSLVLVIVIFVVMRQNAMMKKHKDQITRDFLDR